MSCLSAHTITLSRSVFIDWSGEGEAKRLSGELWKFRKIFCDGLPWYQVVEQTKPTWVLPKKF